MNRSKTIRFPSRRIAPVLYFLLGMMTAGEALAAFPSADFPGRIPLPSVAASARAGLEDLLGRGIHRAVMAGDAGEIRFLLARRPELLEHRDARGFTPLHLAVLADRQESIRLLLGMGASVGARTGDGEGAGVTALHLAVLRGSEEAVERLLAAGADANDRDENGVTALHISAYLGNARIAEMLVARCADVNAREKKGYTPLHLASETGSREVVWMLLRAGADASARDAYGRTARFFAEVRQNREIEGMIRWAAGGNGAASASPQDPACRTGG